MSRWRLKVGSDWDSWILTGNEFQTLGVENQKARGLNVKLWRRTESWWELDEHRDLVGSWCCKRSERYGLRPVCKALKVKVASLNHICCSVLSQWSCLRRSLLEESGDVWECWYKTIRATASGSHKHPWVDMRSITLVAEAWSVRECVQLSTDD